MVDPAESEVVVAAAEPRPAEARPAPVALPVEQPATPAPAVKTAQAKIPTRAPLWAKLLLAANIILFVAGWFHIVYGEGVHVCLKDGWSLDDTFVDINDYAGHPVIQLLPKAKVVRALVRAGYVKLPEGFGDH